MVSSIGGSGGFDMSAMKQMQEKMFKAMDTNGDGKVDKNELSAFQKTQQANGKQGGPSVDEIFKKSDTNSDGGITLQEMQDSMAKIAQQMMQGQAPPSASGGTDSNFSSGLKDKVFKSADLNGDGSISKDELSKLLGNSSQSNTTADALMNALDTNKDGSISKSESDAAIDKVGQQRHVHGPPPPPADSSSSSSDKTSSNQIFDALDTNKDGTISASELLAALSSKDSSSSDNSSSDTSSSSSSSSADSSAVKKIFDAMDTNQDGSISKSELEAALTKKGQHHHSHSQSTADSSSTTSTTDTAKSSDSALFAAAAKSYMQASFSSLSQNAATSALSASSLYA